ncbi:MAG: Abortive infection protein [Firmicutes bacterium]|nr:Abortive infection protein [Bacillota bacterium]
MPSKIKLFFCGVLLWLVSGLLISRLAQYNYYLGWGIWVGIALVASVAVSIKLKKITEMRWGIALVLGCLIVPYLRDIFVVSYIMWGYSRWKKKTIEALGTSEIEKPKVHFLVGVKVRYFLLWYVVSVIVALIGAVGAMVFFKLDSKDMLPLGIIIGFVEYGVMLFWILGKFEKYDIGFRRFIGVFPKDCLWQKDMVVLLFAAMFSLGISHFVLYAESFVFPEHVRDIFEFNPLRGSSGLSGLIYQSLYGILIVIIGPIMEEFIFRGIILRRLVAKWGLTMGIIVSSFLFGIAHLDERMFGTFMVGVILAVLYVKTKTILIPILAHMLNNFVAYVLLCMSLFFQQPDIVNINGQLLAELWTGAIFLIVSLPGICYYLWNNWPKEVGDEFMLTTDR